MRGSLHVLFCLLLASAIENGEQCIATIEFRFQPISFTRGAIVSAMSFVALTLWVIVMLVIRNKPS